MSRDQLPGGEGFSDGACMSPDEKLSEYCIPSKYSSNSC